MSARRAWRAAAALAGCGWLAGCGGFGKVEQGRVVAYDAEQGLITVILDSNPRDPWNPRYDALPPATVRVPADRSQMGPAPRPGRLLSVDLPGRRAVVFDAAAQSLRAIAIVPVEVHERVADDDPRVKGAGLPKVDAAGKTVTVYAARQRQLVTFAVVEAGLALPRNTWQWGDEVRYYYKVPGQALRLMNVSRTDITKGK